jgi:hypothetical protein
MSYTKDFANILQAIAGDRDTAVNELIYYLTKYGVIKKFRIQVVLNLVPIFNCLCMSV